MSKIPESLDALLDRSSLAKALTEAGFPTAKSTLDTMATRGDGPPIVYYGAKPLYEWGSALSWARGRLSRPVNSTAEIGKSRRGRPKKQTTAAAR